MRPIRRSRALLTLLWRADRRRTLWLAGLAILIGVLPNVATLLTGAFLSAVPAALDHGLGSPAGHRALLMLVLLSVGFGASGAALAAARYLSHALGSAYAGTLGATVARACLAPPHLTHLEDARTAGEVESLTDFERAGLHTQLVPSLRMVVSRRIGGVGAALLLLQLAWWAPLVIAAGWIASGAGLSRWMERGFAAARAEGGQRLRRAEYVRSLAVRPEPAKEIRIFGLAGWIRGEYVSTWRAAMAAVWQARRIGSKGLALGTVALVLAHAVVLAVMVRETLAGRLEIGAVTVVALALLGTEDLGFLGDAQWRVGRAAAIAGQVLDLERRLASHRPPSPTTTGAGPAEVTLERVQFAYPGATSPVIDGLDLHIRAGESVAVVGVNGAGKTTLMKLICGLYEPDQGTVTVDRQRIGVIFQDFVRYELPLRDNVGFGSLALRNDDAELAAALTDAGAASLLDGLPHGWATVLAPHFTGGADLSGGQWQKVALARALVAVRGGAGLLILDEPTAGLDIRAEAELFDLVRGFQGVAPQGEHSLSLTRGVTTILVSHRLSSVRHADRIVVLAGGRIVEDGSHDELIAAGGRYAHLFRLQAERFAEV